MTTLLIAGDSFSADWTVKYPDKGWPNLLNEYYITNLSQAGASEYKIYKQMLGSTKHDKTIICHTSPYRIPVIKHPVHHSDPLHCNSDLIYADIVSHDNELARTASKFYENLYDLEYAEFSHNLLVHHLLEQYPDAKHITFFKLENKNVISFNDIFEKHRGDINHLNEMGNLLVLDRIRELLY